MLTIALEGSEMTFRLSHQFIRKHLSGSLLASVLEDYPDETLTLPSGSPVTAPAMACLVALSNGTEPGRHVPELISAHRYLGLSELLCYADPLYDDIVDRKNGGADENIIVLHKILRADRVGLYRYLVQRGATVTLDDLLMATRANAVGIVKFILETASDQQSHGSRCLMLAVAV